MGKAGLVNMGIRKEATYFPTPASLSKTVGACHMHAASWGTSELEEDPDLTGELTAQEAPGPSRAMCFHAAREPLPPCPRNADVSVKILLF